MWQRDKALTLGILYGGWQAAIKTSPLPKCPISYPGSNDHGASYGKGDFSDVISMRGEINPDELDH